jgi:hypothetical protein
LKNFIVVEGLEEKVLSKLRGSTGAMCLAEVDGPGYSNWVGDIPSTQTALRPL